MLITLLVMVSTGVATGGLGIPEDIQSAVKKIIEQMDRLIISTIIGAAKSVYWQAWRAFVGKFSYVH